MKMNSLSGPLMLIAATLLLWLFLRILRLPLKLLMKLLLHAAVGFIALFVLNFLGSSVGISLSITPVNCILAGALGVPGVLLMLLFKYVI